MRAFLIAAALCLVSTTSALAQDPVERGRYLATAGHCAGCHTGPGGAPYAGGLAIHSNLGTLVSANITPDAQTGIGAWNADQFYRAMHLGRDDEGHHLYPAMPYGYFTRVTRADSDAIFAYLRTVPAVSNAPKRNLLPFPFNIRGVMAIWNLLYFHPGERAPDPARSAEWNRGAYLVEGLGHCGGCHTALGLIGGPKENRHLQGGAVEGWYAPDITSNTRQGIGAWKQDELVAWLKTGRNAHAAVTGPMTDVVKDSTAEMTDPDLAAIAAYLTALPPSPARRPAVPDKASMTRGAAVYAANCAHCHQAGGEGEAGGAPPLAGHAGLQQDDPATTLRVILGGAVIPEARMPAFGEKLSDADIAAVATYARNSWGNHAPGITAAQATKVRRKAAG